MKLIIFIQNLCFLKFLFNILYVNVYYINILYINVHVKYYM